MCPSRNPGTFLLLLLEPLHQPTLTALGRALHARCLPHRMGREWLRCDEAIVAYMRRKRERTTSEPSVRIAETKRRKFNSLPWSRQQDLNLRQPFDLTFSRSDSLRSKPTRKSQIELIGAAAGLEGYAVRRGRGFKRETVQSTLTQAALQSTKTITESLEQWRKTPGTRTLLHALPSITKLRRTAGLAASSGHV